MSRGSRERSLNSLYTGVLYGGVGEAECESPRQASSAGPIRGAVCTARGRAGQVSSGTLAGTSNLRCPVRREEPRTKGSQAWLPLLTAERASRSPGTNLRLRGSAAYASTGKKFLASNADSGPAAMDSDPRRLWSVNGFLTAPDIVTPETVRADEAACGPICQSAPRAQGTQ